MSVRTGQTGDWVQHFPEIVIADEELLQQPALTWPEAPEALAYRVVIRDDELDETVSKYGFLVHGGEGRLGGPRYLASTPRQDSGLDRPASGATTFGTGWRSRHRSFCSAPTRVKTQWR